MDNVNNCVSAPWRLRKEVWWLWCLPLLGRSQFCRACFYCRANLCKCQNSRLNITSRWFAVKIVCYAVNFCSTSALHKNMRFNLENQNINTKVRPRNSQVPIRNTVGAHLARWSRKLRRDMMASPGLTCFSVLVISPSVAVLQGYRLSKSNRRQIFSKTKIDFSFILTHWAGHSEQWRCFHPGLQPAFWFNHRGKQTSLLSWNSISRSSSKLRKGTVVTDTLT